MLAEETRRVVREWLMGGEAELQVRMRFVSWGVFCGVCFVE